MQPHSAAMVVFATTFTAISADAARITHDMQIVLERRSGGFINTVGFNDGPGGIEVPVGQGADGVTNPNYNNTGIHGDNPLYAGPGRAGSPDDFATISSIDFQVFFMPYNLSHPPQVHRDLVMLNVVLTSDLGSYSLSPGVLAGFSSDGPMDYTSEPILWTTGADVTLFLNGDPLNVDDCWVMHPGSTILATTIPAPAGALALTLAAAFATRRRR